MEIPVGFAQVNMRFAGPPIPLGAEITFGVALLTGFGPTPTDVANDVKTAYDGSDLESVIGSGADLQSILVKFGPNDIGPSAEVSAVIASDGGTPCDSPATSVLVHKNTSFGGRAGRGRLFLPNPPDAGIGTGGALDPTFVGQVNTRLEAFRVALVGQNIDMMLLHNAGSPLTDPSPVTSLTCDSQVATQRRRNRK